ncbi:hypothetical protein [Haloechinothrix salitolerans]|uniref:Uncharacterized protein n=1 Tax=Haloechinothrix salitolerans TaxID=926830 RepID=A0ABW2BVN3_9PSEU
MVRATAIRGGTRYRYARGRPVRRLATAAASAGLLLTVLPPGAAASTDPGGGCPVVGTAVGVQVTVSASDNLLLSAPTGAGVPVAQACVDYAVRDSRAFASSPYPGETVLAGPGLLGQRLGQDVPGYPAYASSRHPARGSGEANGPGYDLRASSDETTSTAWARSGGAPENGEGAGGADGSGDTLSVPEATVDPDSRSAAATASSDTRPLTINDVLTLGQVHSTATAELSGDGTIRRDSDLRIGRTTVAGAEVVITPKGVKAADQTVGLPEQRPADALEQAGIDVEYLAAEKTKDGVLSAGVQIVAEHTDPGSGATYTVTYTVGRAFAGVAPVRDDSFDRGGGLDAPPPPKVAAEPPARGGARAAEPPGGPSPANAPAPEPDQAPEPAAAPEVEPPETQAVRQAGNPIPMGVGALYLAIVLGALAMVVSATMLRLLGVKTRWTS